MRYKFRQIKVSDVSSRWSVIRHNPSERKEPPYFCCIISFGDDLLSIPLFYYGNTATTFHPTFGIMIAEADTMYVKCGKPLAIDQIEDGTYLIDVIIG